MTESVTQLVTRDSSRPRDGSGRVRVGELVTPPPNDLPPLTATEVLLRTDRDFANDAAIARKARRIALTATEQIDQGALIGYPILQPDHLAFIETVVFYAAREAMES